MRRGPRDRDIVRLLYSGEKGVDAGDHALVGYGLDGPPIIVLAKTRTLSRIILYSVPCVPYSTFLLLSS